eukprot:PhF_6_TR42101/c0_g1_i2/m.63562/K06176/truD, PUS7; tRNA pseudouridine13 synthase
MSRRKWYQPMVSPGVDAQFLNKRWQKSKPSWSKQSLQSHEGDRVTDKVSFDEKSGTTRYTSEHRKPTALVSPFPVDSVVVENVLRDGNKGGNGSPASWSMRTLRMNTPQGIMMRQMFRFLTGHHQSSLGTDQKSCGVKCFGTYDTHGLVEQTLHVEGFPYNSTIVEKMKSALPNEVFILDHFANEQQPHCVETLTSTRLIRNIAPRDVSDIALNLSAIQEKGFINYYQPIKFNIHSSNHHKFVKNYITKDYRTALESYVSSYAPIHKELFPLWREKCLQDDPKQARTTREVLSDVRSLEKILGALDQPHAPHHVVIIRKVFEAFKSRDYSHTALSRILHHVIPRADINQRLLAVSELTFNAMCSLRLQLHGRDHVVVGDLVMERNELSDKGSPVSATSTDLDVRVIQRKMVPGTPRLIRSEDEAKQYKIDDVVLPVFVFNGSGGSAAAQFPEHKLNKKTYVDFYENLGLSPMFNDRLSITSYRHIIARVKHVRWEMYLGGEKVDDSGGDSNVPLTVKHNDGCIWLSEVEKRGF